jgi:hypothetical protein
MTLYQSYAAAFASVTPAGTPSNEGAVALIELLAMLIAAQPKESIDDALEFCAGQLGERVAELVYMKRRAH